MGHLQLSIIYCAVNCNSVVLIGYWVNVVFVGRFYIKWYGLFFLHPINFFYTQYILKKFNFTFFYFFFFFFFVPSFSLFFVSSKSVRHYSFGIFGASVGLFLLLHEASVGIVHGVCLVFVAPP